MPIDFIGLINRPKSLALDSVQVISVVNDLRKLLFESDIGYNWSIYNFIGYNTAVMLGNTV